jgi:hypothetical protein
LATTPAKFYAGSSQLFQAKFAGTNIQVSKKTIVKQRLARGHCFLSLRQILAATPKGFEPEK